MRRLDSFDLNGSLDSIERAGRDLFGLDLLEWQKFRHVIYVGNDASKLIPKTTQPVSEELKMEYQTLAKSHYQAVSNLVCAYQCFQVVSNRALGDLEGFLSYFRAQPEFYFHLGASFDGIARVGFILCTQGQRRRQERMYKWAYSKMRKWDHQRKCYVFTPEFRELGRLAKEYCIEEIYLVRNGATHGWRLPGWTTQGRDYWPEEIKTER